MSISQKIILFAFIILTINGALGYSVYKNNQKLIDSQRWVEHTEQVIIESGNIRSFGREMQIALRDFLITDDSSFLEPLHHAQQTAFTHIGQLRLLTHDNIKQQQYLDSLNLYMQKLVNFSNKTIEVRNKQGLATVVTYTADKDRKRYTDRINQITNVIQQGENVLLRQRKEINRRNEIESRRFSLAIFIIMGGFTIILVTVAGKYLYQSHEKRKRAEELIIANKELLFQNEEKGKRAAELEVANDELSFQSGEKEKRAAELVIANRELLFQSKEKEKRASELIIAKKELFFQNEEKGKRAAELIIANVELFFQNEEKEKCAAELAVANQELLFQNEEKEKRAAELIIANVELSFQNEEKGKRAAELLIANDELHFQNEEKENRAAELVIANAELLFQNGEKEKRAAELLVANDELLFQNEEKEKRAAELLVANDELLFQNEEKEKRAAELLVANDELYFQNGEKENRAAELVVANAELLFQNNEKTKRAAELLIANKELLFQNDEKGKRAAEREFDRNNLDALINNMDDLMWSVDKDFKLITSNQPFDDILKLTSGKVIAKGGNILESTYSDEQAKPYKKLYKRAFAGESFTEIIYNALPVDSWSEISYCPIRKGSEVIGTACHSRDITEKIKAERRLSNSEAFNRGVLNSLSSHVAVIDKLGNIVAVNESWKRFALENGETTLQGTSVGSNYFNTCERSAKDGEDIAAEALQGLKDIFSDKIPVFYLEYPCHSSSEKRWFGMRAMKFDSDDQMVVIAHQNITERKLAEENLLQSESSLKEAQAVARIGNYDVNLVQRSQIWSDQLYDILDIDKSLAPSTDLFATVIHPDDLHYVLQASKSLRSNFMDYRLLRKDGTTRYVYSEWKYEFDKDKKPTRLYGILQDVTERKLAEIDRMKMVNELILRNKDLEQFAYIISHNLRAPVANIIGASSALNDIDLSTEDKAMLSRGINVSITKLDEVVNDLNLILQVKGEVSEIKEMVRFDELVNDIKISIGNLIDKQGIEIKCDFDQIDEFFTLKPYLYSIFFNLISNSVKYRRQDVPCIIEICSALKKNKIELTFSDNGMGINLDRSGGQVFGLYKRFHTNIEGKGMGLFMVKTQVETLGGRISIQSRENEGTEFKIEFEL